MSPPEATGPTTGPRMPRNRSGKRPGRPSPPPPPLLSEPGRTLEGSGILEEVHGGLGVALWQALRSVTLWASSPPGERAGLFTPAADSHWTGILAEIRPPLPLVAPLRRVTTLLAAPECSSVEEIVQACCRISRWAEKGGTLGTALAFAQAAAMAFPQDAASALTVGLLASRLDQAPKAESWLRRSIVLARRQPDPTVQVRACLHLARILESRHEAAAANRMYLRAQGVAKRLGRRRIRRTAGPDELQLLWSHGE